MFLACIEPMVGCTLLLHQKIVCGVIQTSVSLHQQLKGITYFKAMKSTIQLASWADRNHAQEQGRPSTKMALN